MAREAALQLDTLPPGGPQTTLGLSDRQRQAGMRWIIWDGVLSYTQATLTSGVFLTGFALLLGASEAAIGLLSGLPRLSALMQPVGSYFVERLQARKRISVWVFAPARLLWLLVIGLPLVGYAGGASRPALYLLLGVAITSSMAAGFAAVSWLAWMADLIPEKQRGTFFGRRTMLAGATSAAVGYLAGEFIDLWQDRYGAHSAGGFLLVFAVALACGLASWYTLVRCPEGAIAAGNGNGARQSYVAMLREAWADANFRSFVCFASTVALGVWIAGPFFAVYMIKIMKLPYAVMGLLTAANSVGSLAVVRFWGRLSDHFGSRPVMAACARAVGIVPWFYLLTAGGSWWPILACMLFGGAAWSGFMLAEMNMVFRITPEERKSVYIGLFYAMEALPTLFAPLLGGLFLQHTSDWAIHVGSWTFINYHWLFLASGLTRLAALPFFRRVNEPHARSVRHMIRVLSHFRSLNPVLGMHYYAHVVSAAAARSTRRAARRAARALRRLRRRGLPGTG